MARDYILIASNPDGSLVRRVACRRRYLPQWIVIFVRCYQRCVLTVTRAS